MGTLTLEGGWLLKRHGEKGDGVSGIDFTLFMADETHRRLLAASDDIHVDPHDFALAAIKDAILRHEHREETS